MGCLVHQSSGDAGLRSHGIYTHEYIDGIYCHSSAEHGGVDMKNHIQLERSITDRKGYIGQVWARSVATWLTERKGCAGLDEPR
ncbi:hypothetical protein Plhal304r1_c016g0057831 [Plasmopara halstedii]